MVVLLKDRIRELEAAMREAVAILTGQVMSISRRDESVIVLNTALNSQADASRKEPWPPEWPPTHKVVSEPPAEGEVKP
jgi:hypothetical protein